MEYFEPLIIIAIFGAACVSFLWLRDARIFARTGLQGYRSAAYKGVLLTALAWFGASLCSGIFSGRTMLYIGIGLILLALFLHSKIKKEDVWKGSESGWQRFIGSAPKQERK